MGRPRPWLPLSACCLAIAVVVSLHACEHRRARGPDLLAIRVGGVALRVEVADTQAERARGLMDRSLLPDDLGMVFVFAGDTRRTFWMKDTRIPLSIAFVDAGGTIHEVRDLAPMDTTPVTSSLPARYALEVNQGWFAANGLGPGARIEGLEGLVAKD